MKKLSYLLIALMLLTAPYLTGVLQMNNAIAVIQNFGDDEGECTQFATDGDIEDVLRVFNFNLDAMETPTFFDYYSAGIKTIFSI